MVQNRHRTDALVQPRLRLVPPPLDAPPSRPPPLPPEALLPDGQPPATAPPIALPESAFGDWSADSSLSPEVQSQLSRWRRVRQGPWVRRRVFTGDNALPVAPDARRAAPAPPPATPPPMAPASVTPASLARISASAPSELTTEIQAFDLDDDAPCTAADVRRQPPSAAAIAFGAFFVAAATAIAWAIAHLA